MKNFILILVFIIISLATLSCAKSKKELNQIAKIPEASGICFSQDRNTLFVVNDEGSVYEISLNGKILKEKKLGKYDLEGASCRKKDLLLIDEKKSSILIVDKDNLEIQKELKIKSDELKSSKNSGIEAIEVVDDKIYISSQAKIDDEYVIFEVSLKNKKAKIENKIRHKYKDIAGLAYFEGYLYLLSDKKNLLIKYDIKTNQTIKEIKLPKFAGEGVTFDNNQNIYFADDNGAVLKFKLSDIGL